MDRRDAMAMSGPASFYMQRGMGGSGSGTQSGLNVSSGINALTSSNVSFHSNVGANAIGSTLPIENPTALQPHGANVGAPSVMPPSGEPMKRKRGRPRKYGPDGTVSLALSPPLSTHPGTITPTQKRGRGRPPGTGRKQQLASLGEWLSGSAGMGFTPHIITIAVGEDIATKIMSFSQQGPRAICVLSANGAVSTVTLRQPSSSGGTVTYEVIVGSFLWGGLKTKNKKGEAPEGARDLDHQTVEHPITPTSIPPSQNLPPTSSVGLWPGSQPVDMRNTHVDIDLMRG
ncbi:AT-hook motif nuclear-localized protein 9 isoform X2 [Manihot esculenta]|uniref:AT-hook motif nuclear-localized protein 9 isoform X2 n=1 Tax=Manihot esculenta TaxID=3983 RepID=UPI000B5D1705|nr:AT-hook motif nuclear-localized protein 9 isoform X2 [Manihot esculenta]